MHHDAVRLDPIWIQMSKILRVTTYDCIFNTKFQGYNEVADKFESPINMGSMLLPQRKGRLLQYSNDKIQVLQERCDENEVFSRGVGYHSWICKSTLPVEGGEWRLQACIIIMYFRCPMYLKTNSTSAISEG